MRRRNFIALTGAWLAVAGWSIAAVAQAPRGVTKRIGFIASLPENDPADPQFLAAMRAGLASQGWFEGQNLQVLYWWGNSADATAAVSAKAAVDLRLDAILVGGGTASGLALMRLTDSIPIVHALSDPVGLGEVRNPAHPEKNVTGLTLNAELLGSKYVDLLREIAPDLQRVGALTDTGTSPNTTVAVAESAARAAGLDFVRLPFNSPSDLPKVIGEWAAQPRRGLMVTGSLALANRKVIVAEVAARRIPAVFGHLLFSEEEGAILTYSPDQFDVLRRGGEYIGLILNGANVADLPVQDPNKFTLVVNLKAAKAQGIAIPLGIYARADRVIE